MICGTCRMISCSCSDISRHSWKSWDSTMRKVRWRHRMSSPNVGDVSALSMERYDLIESRFFREVLKPFGLQDIIWFPALRTGGRMASMHASRTREVAALPAARDQPVQASLSACLPRARHLRCARYQGAAIGDAGKDARWACRRCFPHGTRWPRRLHERRRRAPDQNRQFHSHREQPDFSHRSGGARGAVEGH